MNEDFCNAVFLPLPAKLKDRWQIKKLIRNAVFSKTYLVESVSKNPFEEKILKIIPEERFSKDVYKKISSIKSELIQKPDEVIFFDGYCYLICKYQKCLRDAISENAIFAQDIIHLANDVSTALQELHCKNILHLDCTPANIYINGDGSFCLGDFSSAVSLKNKNRVPIACTDGYAPPELEDGGRPDFLSDEYVFSCLLYTLFNDGYSPASDLGNIKENIPYDLYCVILKGMSKDPADRFGSIADMRDEINSYASYGQISESGYALSISDPSHPLYFLKTDKIFAGRVLDPAKDESGKAVRENGRGEKIKEKNDKKNRKKRKISVLNVLLILFTGSIFVFSLYSFVIKPQTSPASPKKVYSNENLKENGLKSNTHFDSPSNPPVMDLSKKNITTLDDIKYPVNLKELYLSDNEILDVSPLEDLRDLEILVLSYNDVRDVSPICSLTKIAYLDLAGNKNLSNISELAALNELKALNLTNTNITKKEAEFLKSRLVECRIFY